MTSQYHNDETDRRIAEQLARNVDPDLKLANARAALDRLAHRLRDGGPETSREHIRNEVLYAAGILNEFVPRSILR